MKMANLHFSAFIMVSVACFVFAGCNRFCSSPQFVVISKLTKGDIVKIYPLFTFDIHESGNCQVTYVDVSGRILCRVNRTNLPAWVADRYKRRIGVRQCSGEATICISENGQIKLTQEELSDLSALIRIAPPDNSVIKKLHPSFVSVFKTSLEQDM